MYEFVAPWIILMVHSAFETCRIGCNISAELARNNIGCNVIADYFHDHIFVGVQNAEKAVKVLSMLAGNYRLS